MPKYIRKPVIVDAEPYEKGLEDGYANSVESLGEGIRGVREVSKPYIQTDIGKEFLEPGDYIVVDDYGNRSVVPPKIFELTYTRAD